MMRQVHFAYFFSLLGGQDFQYRNLGGHHRMDLLLFGLQDNAPQVEHSRFIKDAGVDKANAREEEHGLLGIEMVALGIGDVGAIRCQPQPGPQEL